MLTTDTIISLSHPDYASIANIEEVPNTPYCYQASLIENKLSQKLISLCEEYEQCIDEFSPILADMIEEEIATFELCLRDNAIKIFELRIIGDRVRFFTKYRCAEGFLEDYRYFPKKNILKDNTLYFICQKIDINPQKYWETFLQVAFVNDEQYLSVGRNPYEQELYFEYNEQTHYIYVSYKEVEFELNHNILHIQIAKEQKSNCPFTTIHIELHSSSPLLERAIVQLKKGVIE